MYNKILVATDGKEFSKKAIDQGIELAKVSGARIYALYVIDVAEYASTPMDAAWEERAKELRIEGGNAIRYVVEKAQTSGLEAERVIIEGYPHKEIIRYAKENSIDLIVVGTSGKNWLDRFLSGSVSEKIIHESKIPILVVPGKGDIM